MDIIKRVRFMDIKFHYIKIADDVILYEDEEPSELSFVLVVPDDIPQYFKQGGLHRMWFSEIHPTTSSIIVAEMGMISDCTVRNMINNYSLPNSWEYYAQLQTTNLGDPIPHTKTLENVLPLLKLLLNIKYYI